MSEDAKRATNHLADETSLYLRQHMYNPVEWYPWGPAALERAQREDKPLLVSIGYSACHWCHVMEHESFEDPDTAALMNERFVCIKVDREERPDVDQIYMDTVVRMHGHGGWPLNVFCTPDGRPFYGGTYFPPEPRHGMPAFRQVLEGLARAYHEERDHVEETAGNVMAALAQQPKGTANAPPGAHLAEAATRAILGNADPTHGGFGSAPKFPTPTNLDLLLAAIPELPPPMAGEALEHVVATCRAMARGGIYDQLGGGFHRYSVDAEWLVPHFEKMLYDEGQLIRTYAEAWRMTGCSDASLVWPIEETVDYLRREMTGPEGAFFASQDADSEGVEGKFYVWTPDEVEDVIGDSAATAFGRTFDVTPHGNFEGNNILRDLDGGPRVNLADERRALFQARTKRVPPATDEKRVAAWNGLAISGLARAGSLLEQSDMISDAARAADFVLAEMRDDRGRIFRVFNQGRARVPGFLDDVAALLEASLDLYRTGAGDRFLTAANELATDVCERFFEEDESDVFLTPRDGEALAHRPRSDHDGATPNAAGWALLGLLRTATLAGRDELRRVAEAVLRTHAFPLERAPHAYPTMVRAAVLAERGPQVAVVIGAPEAADTRALAVAARRLLRPEDAVVVSAPGADPAPGLDPFWLANRQALNGRATAYLCHGTRCSLPVTDPEALAEASP